MLQRSLTQMEEEESKVNIIQQQLKQQVRACTIYTLLCSSSNSRCYTRCKVEQCSVLLCIAVRCATSV
jgi:hypothetical protein